MLYVTTRGRRDAFTAHKVLCDNRAPDGGLYIPFRDPSFSHEEILQLKKQSFSKSVTDILNRLFQMRMNCLDVELAIGRYPVRMKNLNQRLVAAECWHNLESDYAGTVKNLTALMRKELRDELIPGDWTCIAIRIAVLFGIFGELMRTGIADVNNRVDVAVTAGDFSIPISVWYARKWGLPIGNIVCCCNENGNLWDFICHGQLRTDGVAKATVTPDVDIAVPTGIERLIHFYGGETEVSRYLDAIRRGASYYMDDKMLRELRNGIYVTVNSGERILSAIPAVYATHYYLLSPYGALIYSGLQDYRSRTGENRVAVMLIDKSPVCELETTASALGISADDAKIMFE